MTAEQVKAQRDYAIELGKHLDRFYKADAAFTDETDEKQIGQRYKVLMDAAVDIGFCVAYHLKALQGDADTGRCCE